MISFSAFIASLRCFLSIGSGSAVLCIADLQSVVFGMRRRDTGRYEAEARFWVPCKHWEKIRWCCW